MVGGGIGMITIMILMFVTAAGFGLVVIATVLVIIGVHQEERRQTLLNRRPPTIPALLARRVLGSQFDISAGHQPGSTIVGKSPRRPDSESGIQRTESGDPLPRPGTDAASPPWERSGRHRAAAPRRRCKRWREVR
jgi:hypothetical protein